MNDVLHILVINPGSTSTKVAFFSNDMLVMEQNLSHSIEDLAPYKTIIEQMEFRKKVVIEALKDNGIDSNVISAIVGRGGLLRPMEGGTYAVNSTMLEDLITAIRGEHASNLGAIIAHEIAIQLHVPAFIVDPVVVDEMEEVARISGLSEIKRISVFHALNQKAIARKAALDLGRCYNELNMIIAHLGGGISIGAHRKGRVVDVNNALDGDGPFSPERAGSLPAGALVKMCFSGLYTIDEIKSKLTGKGGLVEYLNTNDGRKVTRMIEDGDKEAELVYRAMAYQIAKEIGACAVVLDGKIDVICITGGLAYDKQLISWIKEKIDFLGPLKIYPGEDEMSALAEGALRVLRGEEPAKEYN